MRARAISVYGALGAGEGLALRAYTTRLLGRRAGAGAARRRQYLAQDARWRTWPARRTRCCASRARAGTWATIDPSGFAAVRLAPLRKLRALDDLSDEDMVRAQRAYLHRSAGAGPLGRVPAARLHAAQVRRPHPRQRRPRPDRPAQRRRARPRGLRRPPGARALQPARLRPRPQGRATCSTPIPKVEGLILDKHGIFTFGASAREAYERMIEMVTPGRGAPAARAQGGVQGRGAAEGDRAAGRGGADPARRLQPGRSSDRRRVAAAGAGVSRRRCRLAVSSTARRSPATPGPAW